MATSFKKKDYYQFCYDENEVVSSNDSSYDDGDYDGEDLNSLNSEEDDDNNSRLSEDEGSCENIVNNIIDPTHEIEQQLQIPTADGEQPYNSDIQQQQQHNNKTTIRSQSYNDHLGDFLSKEGLEKGDHHSSTVPERRSRSCCFETDPFDGLDMMADEDTEFCSRDSKRSSPTSESIELDGYVIEIDEVTNTININSSPPQSNLLLSNSTEFLDVPSTSSITDNYAYIGEDDLSSSGVSLDSRISSANSLTTEINRLRNINSPMYIKDTPYHKRYRISNGGLGGSEDRLSRKPAAKSMNSLISRSSTPDRIKSPLLDFLKGKGKISEAKSDFELTKKKKSMMKKFSSKDASLSKSMFRLKRSSSPFKQKNKSSKNMGKVLNQNTSDPELTLQQPSPFVKTIFQFIETDSDEMFPFGVLNNYENYVVPVFSSNHGKLFQDLGKNNSLSRRVSKNKNNLSLIKRTVYQDGHDPIFLSSCRRVCENSDFLISTVAFLDRVRKVQETPQKRTTVMVETNRRHTINCENDVTVKKTLQPEIQQDEISNRLGHNTIRRKFNLPLTIHERFSTFSDSGVFDDDIILSSSDCLIKAGIPPSRSRSFSNLSETTEKDKKSLGLTRRSKSLRNLAYSSFRRKDKKKSKNQEKNRRNSDLKIPTKNTPRVSADPKSQEEGASDTQESSVPSGKKNSDEFRSNDIRTDNTYKIHQSNKSSIKTTLLTPSKVCEENLKETPNNVAFNEQKRRENMKDIYVTKNVNNTDVHNKVTSSTRLSSPINSEYVEKQYKPIKFLTDKLRNKNKKINKITEVEYLTSHNDISMELKPPAATISGDNSQLVEDSSSPKSSGVINLRRQFEEVTNKKEDASSDRMADTSKEPKDSKRKSGIRRSLSWRVKKDKPIKDDSSAIESAGPTSPASPGSPTKEKTGKLSSLRSKFEPLSPSEKKKWSLLPLSPSNKRSHKNTSKELPKLMEVSNSIDCPSSPLSDSATDDSDHSSKSPARSEKFSFSKFSRSKSTNSTTNNSANSSGSITSGRKISNEMLQDIISGCIVIPSSPELTKATPPTIANDSRHHKLIVNNSSSDFYSGDSSLFDDNRLKLKATPDTISRITDRKSSNDSSNNVGDDGTIKRKTPKANVPSSDEGSIVVDVPLHLLPPQIAGHQSKSSPKSSPKNELRHLFSNKSSRRHSPPTTSPVVKPKKPSSSENLNFHKSFKEKDARHRSGSSTEEISIGNMPNEVNNNFILSKQQTLNHQEIRDQNAKDVTMTTPTSSPPAVKPKPTTNKLRSVAVVKPKTLPSNIAMVSPIMKSEMMSHAIYSPSTPNDTRITELAMSPFKTVKRRPANNNTTLEPSRNRTSESWNVVKKVELSLLLDQDTERKNAVKIESLEVKNANSYRDIEELAVQAFIDHLQSLDEQMLDIGKDDLICLQLGKIKVSLGSSLDLSSVHVEDGILPCQLCLKGKKDWSLATMAYDTLIPKSFLEKYVSLILTHRQVIFYGPSGTGKSYVARRVASIITHRMNENRIPTIVFKNITESQWKTLLRSISDDKKAEPYVVLLDGFAPSFIKSEKDLTEIINACETVNPQPYVICTVTQSPNYEIPTLWQNCFKWIWLPNHEEPVDGLLHRYLRRRHMQTGDKNQDNTQKAFRIAEWLASTWRHINDILEKYHSTECTIGPTMFYTCPTDIECVEEWFLDLWNYSITPYFIQTVKSGLKLFGQRYDWVDPLEKILKTYPWLSVENQRISKLRRIRPEDVGYQPNNPPSCPSSPTQYSETEKERLLDFLRQLELLMHDGGLGELPSFDEATRDPVESSI